MINKLELELHDDIISAIEKIKNAQGDSIEVQIPEGAILLDNSINLKLLKKEAQNFNKSIHFYTPDESGKVLISMMNGDEEGVEGFVTKEVQINQTYSVASASSKGLKSKLPALSLPAFSMPKFGSLSLGGGSKKYALLALFILFALGGILYFAFFAVPEAQVKLTVESQPLIKSVEISTQNGVSTDSTRRILKGTTNTVTTTETLSIETTGEKQTGDKASGSINIFNKTEDDIDLDEGDILQYKEDDLVYVLTEDVTVPGKTELPPDPGNPGQQVFELGEASADIEAFSFGSNYNIGSGEDLEFDDYKTSELTATTDGDIDGGSSKTVKVVAEEDITKLTDELSVKLIEESEKALRDKNNSSQSLVAGSTTTSITAEEFSGVVGDELEELQLTQTATAVGLFYAVEDLNNLLDSLVESFVPEGFKLSDEEREVEVQVLGNSDSTVLSSEEADLQVTLKTFVVPAIDEEELIKNIAGKSLSDAETTLKKVRNVQKVEIIVSPNIPLLSRMPAKEESISLQIELN